MVNFAEISRERKRIKLLTPQQRLDEIKSIIEQVDNRCLAADGPVTRTLQEMTQKEISTIYRLSGGYGY